MSVVEFTAQFDVAENGWVQGQLKDLPGVITAAPSLNEAKDMLADALREYLLSLGGTEGVETSKAIADAPLEIVIRAA